MSKVDRFDRVISSLMTFAAVGTLALVGWRQFNAPPPSPSSQRSIRRIDKWEQRSRGAVRQLAYAPGSKVALTVFTDFECPFCRRLDSLLVDYRGKNPGEISLQIIHLPLSMHLNALPAAQAFECAYSQQRQESLSRIVFERQSALGDVAWDSVASEAGVPSLELFRQCMSEPVPSVVKSGVALAKELNITGTPTVLVNDWLVTPADPNFIIESIRAVAEGKVPKP